MSSGAAALFGRQGVAGRRLASSGGGEVLPCLLDFEPHTFFEATDVGFEGSCLVALGGAPGGIGATPQEVDSGHRHDRSGVAVAAEDLVVVEIIVTHDRDLGEVART